LLGATVSAQVTPQGGDTITVPGSDVQVRLWTQDGAPKSAVSRDGGKSWIAMYEPRYELSFRDFSFDPKDGDPVLQPDLMAANDNRLFYVQFKTDIVPEYRDALIQLGAEVLYHFPYQSYIVRMDRSQVSKMRSQDYVYAVADMHPAYKLDRAIIAELSAGSGAVATYDIMLANKRTDAKIVEAKVGEIGAELLGRANGGILVTAKMTAQQARRMASENSVLWIEEVGAPELDVDNLRIVTGANTVEGLRGTEFGKGISGHIVEGVSASHVEFQARAPYRTAPMPYLVNGLGGGSTTHGTNTAGIIYSAGLNNPQAKGMLPFGQSYFTDYNGTIINTNNRYAMTQDLVDPNQSWRCLIQTASWGYPTTTAYTSRSAEMDDILGDFDLFVTNSQSNTGNRNSRPQAWAKDVNGIGGFNHNNNADPTDDCWCGTGSIGPAQDGRVGVTFANFYDSILTVTGGGSSYSSSFGGTSGATPCTNGTCGAVIEMITDGLFGATPVSWQNRFDARPHYTTTRVAATLGTHQLPFNRANRFQQGWGQPNLLDLYNNRDNILLVDEEIVLTQGQSRSYIVWVKPETAEFRASMTHAEDEAVPNAIPTRHNSLDLTVLDPNGNAWLGNSSGIIGAQFCQFPGGELNDKDTHENVFLQNPVSGIYTVTVAAPAVRMDNHKETPDMDVDFALAIRGIGGGRDTSGMLVDVDSTAPGNWTVAVSNMPGGVAGGFTFMSFSTASNVGQGNLFGLEIDGLTFLSLAPASAGNVFSFTNSPGVYPNATHTFPAGVAFAASGMTVDAVVAVYDGSGNIIALSNVDRATIQ
jgi:hypothetical protein